VVRGYSGGMRRRLDVAAALLHRPAVLFLDEPTTGLDPESRFALWDSVRDLARSGTTVLLTTQYLEEADTLADQVVIISAGRVADTGTPAELKARFGTVVFHLDFGGQEAARAAQAALASAGYRPRRTGAAVQVRSAAGSGELAGMLRTLAGRAPDPVSVAVREPTLDDVFLSLTRGGEAA
jgi:ABC-2 type transport system ATP-binding protein